MIRRFEILAPCACLVALASCASAMAEELMLTGEVQAQNAQPIYTPPSNSSPVVLRYFVPEGHTVKAGEVVLRIDPGDSLAQIRKLDAQIEQAQAKAAKELAELQVKAVDAELALADAQATHDKAEVMARVPPHLISGLDYDRYQGESESAERELALKRREVAEAQAAAARREADGRLEVAKLRTQRDYHSARVQVAQVRATKSGVVVHGFNTWQAEGGRYDEGSSSHPGQKVGEIVSGGPMRVRAWALEPDRRSLAIGQTVHLSFDALPGQSVEARIAAISGAPESKPEWGQGRYFAIDIGLPKLTGKAGLGLLSGMSVRVEVATTEPTKQAP